LINENCRLLLQIHDELIFEIKKDQEKGFIEQIKKVMESIFDLLEVNIEKGPNLGELLSINKH
jgi:DNA polymerase-1